MKRNIWYTAKNACFNVSGKWSSLTHVKEVVSLDTSIGELAFKPDYKSEEEWKYCIIVDEIYGTCFYSSLAFVLENTKSKNQFNLFAVIHEPSEAKSEYLDNEFEFIGYELLDKPGFDISVLTNRWPLFDEITPSDINTNGLISDYKIARNVQQNLKENQPDVSHTDCDLFEVWRHKTIGRK